MKRALGVTALSLALSTCASDVFELSGPASEVRTGSFATADGKFSALVPATWHIEDHWPDAPSFLTNFALGTSCCGLRDGQIKIDIFREPLPASSKVIPECSSRLGCDVVSAYGRDWTWVYADAAADGSATTLTASTIDGEVLITAVGLVPSGPSQRDALAEVERIFRTFRVR